MITDLFNALCNVYELNDEQKSIFKRMVELTHNDSVDTDIEFDDLVENIPYDSPIFDAFVAYTEELPYHQLRN